MRRLTTTLLAVVFVVTACGDYEDTDSPADSRPEPKLDMVTPVIQDINQDIQWVTTQRPDGVIIHCVYYMGLRNGVYEVAGFFDMECFEDSSTEGGQP